MTAEALALAGQRAAAEATRLWDLDVYDPPIGDKRARTPECLAIISGVIDRNGWLSQPYRGNGPPQWCGMFAGDCWRVAGLDPKWLPAFFASTMRLHAWASYQNWNEHKNPAPADHGDRRVFARLAPHAPLIIAPQAGDIVIVGDGNPVDGDHVTVCLGYHATRRTFETISGNGGGLGPRGRVGPTGETREGISRREFAIDSGGFKAMWLIRPAFSDLLAERTP